MGSAPATPRPSSQRRFRGVANVFVLRSVLRGPRTSHTQGVGCKIQVHSPEGDQQNWYLRRIFGIFAGIL
eukprot:5726020-Prymnesium_polylepis.1